MIEKVVVSMAQLNQTAGDLEGNFKPQKKRSIPTS